MESIGWHAFYGCKSLKSVRVPDSVTQFNEDMYKYYKDYIFDENTIVIFNSYLKDIEKKHVSGRLVFCKTPVQEIKSTNAKDLAVKGFLTIEDLSVYDDEVIESYKKYLKGKVVNYAQLIIENDVEMIVRRLASLDLIDSKLVDRMMKENLSNKIKALLSENVKKTGKADGTKKSSGNNGPSITELKKTWSFSKNEEGLTITSYKGNDTKIVIPETIGKDSVTVIGDEVFSAGKKGLNASQKKARSSITEINIPDTVTAIGNGAFNGCGNLSNIKIPEGVISIGSYAFSGCKSLSSIVIPDSVTSIGSYAFQGCINLTNIGIPKNVMYIGDGAFYGCFSLKRFILPHSLKEIESKMLMKCAGLTDITIPNSVISIGFNAFCGCESLTTINIPDSVEHIGWKAFEACRGLTEITIPDSVKALDTSVFWGCRSLKSVVLPKDLKTIKSFMFCRCENLESITIPDNVETIEMNAFCKCSNLISITIPDSVTSIGNAVFDGCSNITIHGSANSSAEKYAKENNIPFEPL